MKNLSLLFIVFLFLQFTTLAQDGWFWQNPLPQGNELYDVAIIDENIIVAVGAGGLVMKTTNGGVNWLIKESSITDDLDNLQFIDDNTGWVTGAGKLYKTTDQGDNFFVALSDSAFNFRELFFINADTGWCVSHTSSAMNYIHKTTNGGASWDNQPNPYSTSITDIFFIDSESGWITSISGIGTIQTKLLKTTDGGENWIFIEIPGFISYGLMPNSVFFTDTNIGWIAWGPTNNLHGIVAKTTNSGYDWFVSNQANTLGGFRSVFFLNDTNGWVVGGDEKIGEISYTTNGGNVWSYELVKGTIRLNCVDFINEILGCTVGDAGAILISDDGSNWLESTKSTTRLKLYSVDFVNQNKGWATGNCYHPSVVQPRSISTIVGTTNGGDTWEELLYVENVIFNSVDFVNNAVGWVVGATFSSVSEGLILKTVDGGITWQNLFTGSDPLNDVFFIDENIGYAAGGADWPGHITDVLKTTDGGGNWFYLTTPIDVINKIYFTDTNTGWFIGSNGWTWPPESWVYKTTDGGVNWVLKSDSIEKPLDIHFIDSEIGWVVGGLDNWNYPGTINKTTDGGNSWVTQLNDISLTIESVYFINADSGWLSGLRVSQDGLHNHSFILTTTNGGEDWIEQESASIKRLNDIIFINENVGWAVGDGGTILKYGEIPTSIETKVIKTNPNSFSISQNFPNPFNSATAIQYSIPQRGNVVLRVYDILGNEIATLVNEEKEQGVYTINFDVNNLASGLYLYRIQAGSFIDTKKMILLK